MALLIYFLFLTFFCFLLLLYKNAAQCVDEGICMFVILADTIIRTLCYSTMQFWPIYLHPTLMPAALAFSFVNDLIRFNDYRASKGFRAERRKEASSVSVKLYVSGHNESLQ